MSEFILKLENLSKSYDDCGFAVEVLRDISLTLKVGEAVTILGNSGSGKTTLLQILGLIDSHDSGTFEFMGRDVNQITQNERDNILKKDIAFVHQFYHLFSEFSALENVIIPQINIGISKKDATKKAEGILFKLGLEAKMTLNPWQLSGGERQRVAIARSIINEPKLILADEPTGSLDPKNSQIVMQILTEICTEYSSSLVLVTHNEKLSVGSVLRL